MISSRTQNKAPYLKRLLGLKFTPDLKCISNKLLTKDDGKMVGSLFHSRKYMTHHTMQERVRYYLSIPTDKMSQAYLYLKAITIANDQAFTARNLHALYIKLNHRIPLTRKFHTESFFPRTYS